MDTYFDNFPNGNNVLGCFENDWGDLSHRSRLGHRSGFSHRSGLSDWGRLGHRSGFSDWSRLNDGSDSDRVQVSLFDILNNFRFCL